MAVKNLAFHFLSAMFSVLVVLANWLSSLTLLLLNPISKQSSLAKNLSAKWSSVAAKGSSEVGGYLQIVFNIVVGVLCSKLLASYHSFLIKTIVTISFQLHLLSLNWVADLPDYSAFFNDSEAFKLITGLLCLVFGYLGLSTLISFILDIILVFSYPFRVMRTVCDGVYASLEKLRKAIFDILTLERSYWITCPYP
jgi:hypothetical protein